MHGRVGHKHDERVRDRQLPGAAQHPPARAGAPRGVAVLGRGDVWRA